MSTHNIRFYGEYPPYLFHCLEVLSRDCHCMSRVMTKPVDAIVATKMQIGLRICAV